MGASAKRRIRGVAESFVFFMISLFKLDTRKLFYETNGILKYKHSDSGEKWFTNNVLPRILCGISEPVVLDIGANVGDYSILLTESLPKCRCYSFEPNPATFERLVTNTSTISNIMPVNYGAGNKKELINLHVYKSDSTTAHASIYKDVFKECHLQAEGNINTVPCKIDKIDNLIESRIVPETSIHFVKLDTEGHELEGLKGSLHTINGRGVRAIQFEFNEMNVISRVFLKDFYDLLGDEWSFFRLDTQKLIPLGRKYDSANEIFKYQNIIAIRNLFLASFYS